MATHIEKTIKVEAKTKRMGFNVGCIYLIYWQYCTSETTEKGNKYFINNKRGTRYYYNSIEALKKDFSIIKKQDYEQN